MSAKSEHPLCVPIVVALKSRDAEDEETLLYISPEWRQPDPKEVTEEFVGSGIELDWGWSGSETLNPFWAVGRLTEAQLTQEPKDATIKGFNVQLINKELSQLVVGIILDGSVTTTFAVTVPVLSNDDHISKGDELILKHEPIKRKEPKAKERNWKTDMQAAAALEKRRKRDADWSASAKNVTLI